uniref:Nuclear protein MDM1 n=1 Tax=Glossina pallidipes TaxID=7398 RepID=A0A1A9ZRT9_GLOPL
MERDSMISSGVHDMLKANEIMIKFFILNRWQLHSEYRSTYRWHEFTGSSRPEVVRRAPAPNPSQFVGATNEPPIPRRKKCPELAYKSHEFIIGSEYTDARNNAANRMPRNF